MHGHRRHGLLTLRAAVQQIQSCTGARMGGRTGRWGHEMCVMLKSYQWVNGTHHIGICAFY